MAEEIARGSICGNFLSARYLLAILGSFAMGITYALKVNLSTAMLGMLNHTAIKNHDLIKQPVVSECSDYNSTLTKNVEDGPFAWNESLQGLILSSYFWGYIVFQIPGGRIAEIISAKWVMFFSVTVNIVCTLLTPAFAKMHYAALIVLRVGEGLGGAVTFPAMHVMLAKWAPPNERSIMSNIVYAGTCLGTVVSISITGVITSALGWEAVFYIMGVVCIPWCFIWVWLIADTPDQQKYISEEERDMISKNLGTVSVSKKRDLSVPWKSVFTSKPFLAILVAHVCSNWGWYMILIELPFYMKQVLNFNVKENALLNAIPYLTMWLFSMLLSKTLDKLRSSRFVSTTMARKLATGVASIIPGGIFLLLCFIGCLRWLAVILMTIAITAKGGMFSGFLSNHIDIAPNFAGTLVALTNTMATIPGIVVPLFVGYITEGNQTIEAWTWIFLATVFLYSIEIILYTLFASGEVQCWNIIDSESNEKSENQPLNQASSAYKATDQH